MLILQFNMILVIRRLSGQSVACCVSALTFISSLTEVSGIIHNGKPKNNSSMRVESSRAEVFDTEENYIKIHR